MMSVRKMAGSSLLEVAIALSLLASATVGVFGAQLVMRNVAHDAAARELAMRLADSRAEIARVGGGATVDWVRVSAGLPGARIDESMRTDYSLVEVRWRRDGEASRKLVGKVRAVSSCESGTCAALAFSAGSGR